MIEPVERSFPVAASSMRTTLTLHLARRSDGSVIAHVVTPRGGIVGRVLAQVELPAMPAVNPFRTPTRPRPKGGEFHAHVEEFRALAERVAELERRLNGVIEQHHLWDGS